MVLYGHLRVLAGSLRCVVSRAEQSTLGRVVRSGFSWQPAETRGFPVPAHMFGDVWIGVGCSIEQGLVVSIVYLDSCTEQASFYIIKHFCSNNSKILRN